MIRRYLPNTLVTTLVVAGCIALACGDHPLGKFDVPDGAVTDDGGLGDETNNAFPDAPMGEPFKVTPSAQQEITVPFGQKSPTVAYTATTLADVPLTAAWAVDRGEVGTVSVGPASTTTFTPSGKAGGLVDVIATANNQTVQRSVLVKLTGSQNGNCPISQIASSVNDLLAGGGVGGVGGEGCGAAVSDPATLAALKAPVGDGSAQQLKFIYPYEKTVWPRQQLAPLLMWSWTTGDADSIKIDLTTSSGSFSWSGTFTRPAILAQTKGKFTRHPIPQDVWAMATESAGGVVNGKRDHLMVSVTLALGGKAYGPITENWDVAPGTLKGTVYYNSYGTRYSTSNWSNVVGAATLAIKHGATSPYLVTSKTQCVVCHSLAANGSRMISEHDPYPGNGQDFDWLYDLKNPASPADLPQVSQLYTWSALNPTGTLMFSNSSPLVTNKGLEGGTDTPSALFSLPSGKQLVTPSLPNGLGGSLPVFSPDGKHIAFNFFKGQGADGKSLAVIDFDGVSTFSNLRVVYTPSCAGCTAVWPSFTATSDALVFEVNTVSNGYFAGSSNGAHGELWWVDLATKTAHRLDAANGKGYLPTGPNAHDDDTTLQFEPTVAPVVSGGYVWVAFMSRRLYGSVATLAPWDSDTQSKDFSEPMTKKVWVSAFDLNATVGTDPSHPAFYLPAQELMAGNFRSYWVLDPCEKDGDSCETGDQCCGGHCISSNGGLVCGPTVNSCAGIGDSCTTGSECCKGLFCIAGHCDVPAPPP